jgi:hypothetical protein
MTALRANPPCGGISVNGATPPCCEVHVLPWGHDRALLGLLDGTVEGSDPTPVRHEPYITPYAGLTPRGWPEAWVWRCTCGKPSDSILRTRRDAERDYQTEHRERITP